VIGSFFMFLSLWGTSYLNIFYVLSHRFVKKPTSNHIYIPIFLSIIIGGHGFAVQGQQKENKSTYPLHAIAPRPLFRFLGWEQLTDQGISFFGISLHLIWCQS
jgi:hypothetical protein